MQQFWTNNGKRITLLFYFIFITAQLLIGLFAFGDLKTKLILIPIQIVITSIAMYMAYKITNKILGI